MLFSQLQIHLSGSQYRRPCWQGLDTGWRKVPDHLLETPTSGVWQLYLESEQLQVNPGEMIFLPAGTRHRLRAEDPEKKMRSSWALLQWENDHVPLEFPTGPLCIQDNRICHQLETLCQTGDKVPDLERSLQIQLEGLGLLRQLMSRVEVQSVQDSGIAKCLRWMQRNYRQPIKPKDLAQQAGLSESKFHDVFHKCTGTAPLRYLNRIRLHRASRLLIHSHLPLQAIAEQTGYQSPFYFNRIFRKEFGQTPNAYRKQFRRT